MSQDPQQPSSLVAARRLLWLYCIVWVIEGALRKWVLPGFSIQLLLVRDPIVLMIYYYSSKAGVFPTNGWLGFLWLITGLIFVQALVQVMMGDVSWAVAAFGVRTFFLHMPLIWVVPVLFGRKEIVSLGKWVLYLAPFLAALMVVQFEVGPDHWLNVASLKGGSQIGSVFGKIRPPALFSFISGPIHYFTLTTAFAIAGVLTKGLFPRWLTWVGAVSILIAMSVSGSRSLVLGCILVAAVGSAVGLLSGKRIGSIVVLGIGLIIAIPLLASFGVLKEGVAAFAERWGSEEESGASGSKVMGQRMGGSFTSAFEWAGRVPIIGLGVGISSNLAAEKKNFILPVESEWERVIYEIGPVTGFLYLAFRVALSLRVIGMGFGSIRSGNYLCILLGAACFFDILTGNLRQVTSYGYMSVCAGLCLAAFKAFSTEEDSDETRPTESLMLEVPKLRGRGRFAVGGNPVQP